MKDTIVRLAEANVNHYNQHPTEHAVITAALFVGAVVGIRFVVRRIVREDFELRSGQYA